MKIVDRITLEKQMELFRSSSWGLIPERRINALSKVRVRNQGPEDSLCNNDNETSCPEEILTSMFSDLAGILTCSQD